MLVFYSVLFIPYKKKLKNTLLMLYSQSCFFIDTGINNDFSFILMWVSGSSKNPNKAYDFRRETHFLEVHLLAFRVKWWMDWKLYNSFLF